jgi:GTPase SAR1 family protein
MEITLNGWDFGGQRVYRPTHQLFFSAPAVYLVVWKPREGRSRAS